MRYVITMSSCGSKNHRRNFEAQWSTSRRRLVISHLVVSPLIALMSISQSPSKWILVNPLIQTCCIAVINAFVSASRAVVVLCSVDEPHAFDEPVLSRMIHPPVLWVACVLKPASKLHLTKGKAGFIQWVFVVWIGLAVPVVSPLGVMFCIHSLTSAPVCVTTLEQLSLNLLNTKLFLAFQILQMSQNGVILCSSVKLLLEKESIRKDKFSSVSCEKVCPVKNGEFDNLQIEST